MDFGSLQQQLGKDDSGRRARQAVWVARVGVIVTAATVSLSVTDTISAQQAVAMALLAALITMAGLIGMTVPDAWTAWRRGFRYGCEIALRGEPGGPTTDRASSGPREPRLSVVRLAARRPAGHSTARSCLSEEIPGEEVLGVEVHRENGHSKAVGGGTGPRAPGYRSVHPVD